MLKAKSTGCVSCAALQKAFQVRLTSQHHHRHQGRIPWSTGQDWNENCRAASPSLCTLYWAEVLDKGTNPQSLATSDICLSHDGCQKIIAVSVKLQIILHNAVLITMKAMAGFEFYSFFFCLSLLLKVAASPRQHFVLRSAWLAQNHFCIALLALDKKVQQVP